MDPANDTNSQNVRLPIYAGTEHPCGYLPGRTAKNEFTVFSSLEAGLYQLLMDAGFRRTGEIVYRPVCDDCRECIPIRIPVAEFSPTRSQRRVLRRNADLRIETGTPRSTDEKWRIYAAYQEAQHDGSMAGTREDFEGFLYQSPTTTEEMTYLLDGRVIAVGIVDVCPSALSSVYFYFDPAHARRSLGVFGAIQEIEACRQRGLPYWYLGYYVRECQRMNYKAQYQPFELLDPDHGWQRRPI